MTSGEVEKAITKPEVTHEEFLAAMMVFSYYFYKHGNIRRMADALDSAESIVMAGVPENVMAVVEYFAKEFGLESWSKKTGDTSFSWYLRPIVKEQENK